MRGLSLALIAAMVPVAALAEIPRDKKWNTLVLAHPNAKMLVGVDWQKMTASPLGPVLVRQVKLGGHPILSFLESIEGVQRLLISSPGEHRTGRKPLLVVVEGAFVLSKIRKMATADGAISRRYNNVELLVPPGATNDDLHFALLDGNTILFGDGSSVKGSIDRWQRPGSWAGSNPVFVRGEKLGETNDMWAIIDDPADSMTSLGLVGTELAEDIEQIEAGFQFGATLSMQLMIRAGSEESTQTLAGGLPALLQLAALQYANQPYLSQVAKRLKVSREKQVLRMGVALEARLLDQSFAELRSAAPLSEGPTAVTAITSGPPVPAAKPQVVPNPMSLAAAPKKVIRIIGAEGGDREIPLN